MPRFRLLGFLSNGMLRFSRRWRELARTVLVALSIQWGCAEWSTVNPNVLITDSAGVVIVRNLGIERASLVETGWQIDEILRIGESRGDSAAAFGRVVDVAAGSNGETAVLDQFSGEVRLFGRDGSYLRTLADRGEGPGQISADGTFDIVGLGDSLLVVDIRQGRVTTIRFDGTGVTTRRLGADEPGAVEWKRAPDGRLLRRVGTGSAFQVTAYDPPQPADTALRIELRHTAAPDEAGRFAVLPSSPVWAPLADGGFVFGETRDSILRVVDAEGRIARTFNVPGSPLPFADEDRADIARILGRRLGSQSGDVDPRELETMVRFPESYPLLTAVIAGPANTIWVQRPRSAARMDLRALFVFGPRATGGARWEVFDLSGVYLGTIDATAPWEIHEIDGDTVYGVMTDELGRDEVVVHRVVPPTAANTGPSIR